MKASWKIESARRATARDERGIPEYVPSEEQEEYDAILAHARKQFSLPPAPAMPVISYACTAKNGKMMAEHLSLIHI